MASQGSAWYVDFFRSDYLNVYGHMFTDERAEKESAFVASALDLQPGASVLDLCYASARAQTAVETNLAERAFPERCPFSIEEMLDLGWLPLIGLDKDG